MSDERLISVPLAIYFDTNAFKAINPTLEIQTLSELIELATTIGAKLFVPKIVEEEWLSHLCSDAVTRMNRVISDGKYIGKLLNRDSIKVENILLEELLSSVWKIQDERLRGLGFSILPTPKINIEDMAQLFIRKRPPFGDCDRGFKDAIVLETIFQHAVKENAFNSIIIVSSDKIFGHKDIISRFEKEGTEVNLVDGQPQDLFPKTNAILNGIINSAVRAIMASKAKNVLEYAKLYEQDIFDFINRSPSISMPLIKGYSISQLGREKDDNDKKLEYARIVSIDSVRPKSVLSAFASAMFPRIPDDGRKSFLVTVGIEIDLTIARTNLFAETKVPIDNASALIEEPYDWKNAEVEESITVSRVIQVSASVSFVGYDSQKFQDFRLESVL